MTGFARSDGAAEGLSWAWEARSVNGRGLDVRLRMPPGFDAIEPSVREAVAKRFSRGNVSLNLALEKQPVASAVRLNEQVLADVLKAAQRIAEITGGTVPDTATLMATKGVLESADATGEDTGVRAARERLLVASLETALDSLTASRRAEGGRLAEIIRDRIAEIERLVAEVRLSPSRQPEAIRERLAEQIGRLMDGNGAFDRDRLHQEAVLMATRADVEEELSRLVAHVSAAREILAEPGAVGRKLDFLAQEFNREANTLCSKANAVDITRLGLQLKAVIDQLREQVQNVE